MKNGRIKKSRHQIQYQWNKSWQSFLPLLYFSQGPHKKGKPVSWFSQCSMSKMQPSLSARAVKSSIRVSHLTTEVLRCHFSSLDESSLVPLISILSLAWKNISQACGFDHIISLYIFLLVPSPLYQYRHSWQDILALFIISFIIKMLVSCLHNAILSQLVIMLSNSYLFALFYILATWEELILLNQFSVLHCVMEVF